MPNPAPLPKLRRPATLDHLRSKPRPWQIVEVNLDIDAMNDLARLEADEKANPKAVAAAKKKVDASTKEILLVAMGSKAYDALLLAHTPTDKQVADAEAQGGQAAGYNIDTFPAALVSATAVEPKMTEAEVSGLFEDWTSGEVAKTWVAALGVNSRGDMVSLGKASSGTTA